MIRSYCNFGIYNDDTSQSLEEGDDIDRIAYWDNGNKVVLKDVRISEIRAEEITVELEDFTEVTILIDDIEDWD